MTDIVYVLQHVRGDDEDVKIIGVYRSKADADAARRRLRELPGFRDHQSGFSVDPYVLNEDGWSAGFGE